MPSIRPFKAIIYNKKKVKDFTKVVAPPYDVIPPAMQSALYKKHENNIVRLILGKIKKSDDVSSNRYTRAKEFFDAWLNKDILIEDDGEAIYIYSQKYKYDGKIIERIGFISALKLELSDKKAVLPHENTLQAPKADRLNLMRSVSANLSPVFMLYQDDKDEVGAILKKVMKATKPFIDISIDGIRNRAWKISRSDAIEKIERFMTDKNVFIADGHHRYETAINYANETGSENSKYTLAYFCKLDDDSLTILPTHRLIKDIGKLTKNDILEKLNRYFIVEEYPSAKKCISRPKELRDYHAFGMYMGGKKFYCLKLNKENAARTFMGEGSQDWKSLDVAILHKFIIQNVLDIRDEDDNIEFVKDADEALTLAGKGKFKIAFLLNPTKVSQMKKVAEHGEKMPRKATYFYPKPLSGLVIRKI
ncbi:MAG: DUF1015 domain-containing protein [Candidatus Omnitrophota bacterium]|nr:DUF1015 domain-containing protein [Candidatus Omnitrophota bacterium]